MKKFLSFVTAVSLSATVGSGPAQAGTDPYLGDIIQVGFTFCPRGWANADGQLLAINSNQSLYSLLGTFYGGDGRTSFALPDLRGRAPLGVGQGSGQPNYSIGQKSGAETVTLTTANLPAHTHAVTGSPVATLMATADAPDTNDPAGAKIATLPAGNNVYSSTVGTEQLMHSGTVDLSGQVTLNDSGQGQPQTIMQPYTVIRYCIATTGAFPPRN
jgi:microcystin-dependent protein